MVGAAALGAGQRQQLVDGVRGAHAGAADLLERLLEFLGVGALALGQVGLHAQARQRRLELVRGVGQEALLRADRVVELVQQVVDRQTPAAPLPAAPLIRPAGSGRRACARGCAPPPTDSGLMPRTSASQISSTASGRIDELRQHHALDDLGGQHRLLLARLGHLQQRQRRVRAARPDPECRRRAPPGRASRRRAGRPRPAPAGRPSPGKGTSRSPLSSVPWASSTW